MLVLCLGCRNFDLLVVVAHVICPLEPAIVSSCKEMCHQMDRGNYLFISCFNHKEFSWAGLVRARVGLVVPQTKSLIVSPVIY